MILKKLFLITKSFLFFIGVFSSKLFADEYHFNNLLIGKNAVGVGGAFTAVADDLSAIYYNPAGLVNVEQGNTASINTFAWTETEYKRVLGNGSDFDRSAFSVVPSFFGIKFNANDWHIGAAFVARDFNQERSEVQQSYDLPVSVMSPFPTVINESANIDIDSSVYSLELAGSKPLNDYWSVGFGISFQLSTIETDQGFSGVNTTSIAPDFTTSSGFNVTVRIEDTNWRVEPSFSTFYKNKNFSFGTKISKAYNIDREYKATGSSFVTGFPPETPGIISAFSQSVTTETNQKFPLSLASGLAYQFQLWQLSFDVQHYFAIDEPVENLKILGNATTFNFKPTTNLAVGAKYQINTNSALRFGLFTDNANTDFDFTVPFQRLERIDLIGVSISYDTIFGKFPIAVGAYARFGDGDVRLSDTRASDNTVGIPLRPPSDNFDVYDAAQKSAVFFFSIDF